jgi:hypothetical protein
MFQAADLWFAEVRRAAHNSYDRSRAEVLSIVVRRDIGDGDLGGQ